MAKARLHKGLAGDDECLPQAWRRTCSPSPSCRSSSTCAAKKKGPATWLNTYVTPVCKPSTSTTRGVASDMT
eukprot:390576-Pleurochrysis_carterae.AAC.1